MIYLDTSIVLAHLLAEDRVPPASIWGETLVSSRLLQYEVWTRIHARELTDTLGEVAGRTLARLAFLELSPVVLSRAESPFPTEVRTLDVLHLASVDYLVRIGQRVEFASYDRRQCAAALAMGIPLARL